MGTPQEVIFVREVATSLRSLGYVIADETLVRGTRFDLLGSIPSPALGSITVAIECKFRTKDNVPKDEVAKFIRDLDTSGSRFDRGLMVTSRGYSPAARQLADEHERVTLTTLDALNDELLDPSRMLVEVVRSYEQSAIFSGFVDLRTAGSGPERNALATIRALPRTGPRVLAVILADFGAGKSTLLERFRYELANEALAADLSRHRTIPLLFRLRSRISSPSLEAFALRTVYDQLGIDIRPEAFWSHLEAGRFTCLLDGFDEMTARANREHRARLLRELAPLMAGPGATFLTCRPSYFVEPGEYNQLLSEIAERWDLGVQRSSDQPVLHSDLARQRSEALRAALRRQNSETPTADLPLDEVKTIELAELGELEIKEYIRTNGADVLARASTTVDDLYDFLSTVYDLGDLIRRPILLKMVLETIEHGSIDVRKRSIELGASQLYDQYTNLKLERDWSKGESRQLLLTLDQRRSFATALAFAIMDDGRDEATLEEIEAVVERVGQRDRSFADALERFGLDHVVTDVCTCTFIGRAGDKFRFAHRSFAEFFVARELAFELINLSRQDRSWTFLELGRKARQLQLSTRRFTPEVLYFLGSFVTWFDDLHALLREFLKPSTTSGLDDLRDNVVGALLRSGPRVMSLSCANVSVDGLRVRGTTIGAARMDDVRLSKCELTDFRIEDSTVDLSFTDASRVTALATQASDAQLRLTSSSLEGASFDGKLFLHARTSTLTDASLTAGTFSTIDLAATNVAGLAMVDGACHLRIDGSSSISSLQSSRCRCLVTAPATPGSSGGARIDGAELAGSIILCDGEVTVTDS
ncbi:MAG TPA: restriction endonuclease, partial [Iamia sp.]|nr:restriction endonuclease [Iamia sp.]